MPRVVAGGALIASLFLAACGKDYPLPNPPWGPFIPPQTGGGGYGSGGVSGSGGGTQDGGPAVDGGSGDGGPAIDGGSLDGGTVDAGPPPCPESNRRCSHEFTYASNNNEEASVEVRGSFRPDGWQRGVPMTLEAGTWKATAPIPWNTQVLYKFRIVLRAGGERWVPDPTNPNQVSDGYGGFNSVLAPFTCTSWTCEVTGPACDTPPTDPGVFDWRDAVLYFVLVDRFKDGDPSNNQITPNVEAAANWQGGDLAGVLQKLNEGYFTQLGVNALWLSSPADAAESRGLGREDAHYYSGYHGYWPSNLAEVEPRLGTMVLLQQVVEAAHRAGIKVLLDYVMNHVHIESPVYQQHPDWFWPNSKDGHDCICGMGCSWDNLPDRTRCWFADYLPTFNFTVDAARAFSVDDAVQWVKNTGVDGYRLDAVKHIETSWITELRTRVMYEVEPVRNQHFYMVGETFTGDRAFIKSFLDPCRMLDGQFDFPLRNQVILSLLLRSGPMSDLISFMDQNATFYGNAIMSTFIGNHDVPRSIHFAQDSPLWTDPWANGRDRNWSNQPGLVAETSAYERLSVAFALLLTNRGIPLIYYGDEIGLPGAGDPDNRRMMTWSGYNAGQNLLLDRVKKLTAVRAAHPALRRGVRTTLFSDHDTWAYSMVDGTDTVYVLLNRSDSARSVGGLPSAALKDALTQETVSGPSVSVAARGFRILTP
jgi:glycosidase